MNLAHCGFEPLTSLTEPCHGLDHVDARKYAQLWFKLWPQESSVNSSGTVSSQPAQDPAALLRRLCRPLHGDDILETDSDHGSVPPTHIDLNEHSELAIGSIGEAAVDQGLAAFALRQEYFRLADVVSMHMQNQIKASQTDGSGVARLLLIGHPGIGKSFAVYFLLFLSVSSGVPVFAQFNSTYTLHFSQEGAFVGPGELNADDQKLREAISQACLLLDAGDTPLSPGMLACAKAARLFASAASPNPQREKQLQKDKTSQTRTSVWYLAPMTHEELFAAGQRSGVSIETVKQRASLFGPFLPDVLSANKMPSQADLDGLVERAMGGMFARVSKLLHGQASTVWDLEDAQLARRVFLLGPVEAVVTESAAFYSQEQSQITFLSPAMEQAARRICKSDRLKTLFKLKKLSDAHAPSSRWLVNWLLKLCLPVILAADPSTISTYNMSMSPDAPLDYQRPLAIETVSENTDCLLENSGLAAKGRLLVERFPSVDCAILLDDRLVVVQTDTAATQPPTNEELYQLLSFASGPDRCIKRLDLVVVGTHESSVVNQMALSGRRLSAYSSEGATAQKISLGKDLIESMEVSGFVWNPSRHSLAKVAF